MRFPPATPIAALAIFGIAQWSTAFCACDSRDAGLQPRGERCCESSASPAGERARCCGDPTVGDPGEHHCPMYRALAVSSTGEVEAPAPVPSLGAALRFPKLAGAAQPAALSTAGHARWGPTDRSPPSLYLQQRRLLI